jgi:hypothetical protein
MSSRLLNLLTLVSLLLCVAVAALWVRSYWVFDQLQHPSGRRYVGVTSLRGRLAVQVVTLNVPIWVSTWDWATRPAASQGDGAYEWQFMGFGFGHGTMQLAGATGTEGIYTAPHWALLVTSAVPAGLAWALRRRRRTRQRRLAQRLCLSCGYDLRATPGRCPECGTAAVRKPA